jgi:transposase
VQDVSRFGLFTINGRALTSKGVKPICIYQNIFKSTYIFGTFSLLNGDSLAMELPYCNGDNFQIFLNEVSGKNATVFKVIVLDNGALHKGKSLVIPQNIPLIFLPPYSPELNPAELVWLNMKRRTTNKTYKTTQELNIKLDDIVKELLTEKFIKIYVVLTISLLKLDSYICLNSISYFFLFD